MVIHDSGQTIFSFTHIKDITLGGGEVLFRCIYKVNRNYEIGKSMLLCVFSLLYLMERVKGKVRISLNTEGRVLEEIYLLMKLRV